MIEKGMTVTYKDNPDFRAEVLALTTSGRFVYVYVTDWGNGMVDDGFSVNNMSYKMLPIKELEEVNENELDCRLD